LLSINEAKYAGDNFINDIFAGVDAKIIKNKIFKYQNEILQKSNLSPKEMELFLKNSNDNFLLGLALALKDRQDIITKDTAQIVKSLNKNNLLLEDMKNSLTDFTQLQAKVLEKIRADFDPSEQEMILNALFDKSNTNKKEILLSPESLEFFRNHPNKLATFKKYLKNDSDQIESLKNIVEIQEKAQMAFAYLQVTTKIANNLDLNPEIIKILNSGESISSAVTSISSFMLTSNPLDALNAISSISGLFSKPKPDPRFSAIFENFKSLQRTLAVVQKQIETLDKKLDNIDAGLKYVIRQNQTIIDLNQEKNNEPLFACDRVSRDLKLRSGEDGLNYFHLKAAFMESHQAENEKINQCLSYLSETFNDSLKYKRVYFSNSANPDLKNDDANMKDYYSAINMLGASYSALLNFQDEKIKDNELYFARNLLSPNTIIHNVRQLLANSFLYDVSYYNRQTHNWDIVDFELIPDTTKKNAKSEALLLDALKLINVAILQQSIIDGNSYNDLMLKNFWLTPQKECSEIQYKSIPCLASLNQTLAQNLIKLSFDRLVSEKYFKAWKKIAPNNDIDDFLKSTIGERIASASDEAINDEINDEVNDGPKYH
jgi:hypothetical protein